LLDSLLQEIHYCNTKMGGILSYFFPEPTNDPIEHVVEDPKQDAMKEVTEQTITVSKEEAIVDNKSEEQAIEKEFEVVEEALEKETLDEGFEVVEGNNLVSNDMQEAGGTDSLNQNISVAPEKEQYDAVVAEKQNAAIEVETIGSVKEFTMEVKEPTKPSAPEPAKLDAPESTEEENTSGGALGLRDVLQDPAPEVAQISTTEIVEDPLPEILQDPITEPIKVTTPELVKEAPAPGPTELVPPTPAASNVSEQGPELTKLSTTITDTLEDKNDVIEDENIASGVAGLRDILQGSNITCEE